MKPIDKYKQGDFNDAHWECLADGSAIITLSKRGEGNVYKFRVKSLYHSDEEELDVVTGEPIAKGNL